MTDRPSFEEWFCVGLRVRLDTHGAQGGPIPAELLEDRGPIARGGRHVVRIATRPDDPEASLQFEVAEDDILLDAA